MSFLRKASKFLHCKMCWTRFWLAFNGMKRFRKENGSWRCFKGLCINSAVQDNIQKSDYSYILNSLDA